MLPSHEERSHEICTVINLYTDSIFLDHYILRCDIVRLAGMGTISDLKIEVFRHFPRTVNVKKSRDQGLAVRFAV